MPPTESAPRIVGKSWAAFDEMTWPIPETNLVRRLMNSPTEGDLRRAVSILEAYDALVRSTETKRRHVVRNLRAAARMWRELNPDAD